MARASFHAGGRRWRAWTTGSASWTGGSSSSGSFFDLAAREARPKELESLQGDPGFWSNADPAPRLLLETKSLKNLVVPAAAIASRLADARGMSELLAAEPDETLGAELRPGAEGIAR